VSGPVEIVCIPGKRVFSGK